MADGRAAPTEGRSLQDLKGLSGFPLIGRLQKALAPTAPRPKSQKANTSHSGANSNRGPLTKTQYAQQAAFQALKQFEPGDYAQWLREYLRFRFGRRHPFLTYDTPFEGVHPLGPEAGEIRVAIAGDWGTGTDEAFHVAEQIRSNQPHFTIHLGDVYFMGDDHEVRANFLGKAAMAGRYKPCAWPVGSKGAFALSGNHEMYARGIAYFKENLPAMGMVEGDCTLGQKASFFCLMNEHWCILGLDTGYNSVGTPFLEYLRNPKAGPRPENLSWLEAIAPSIGDRAIIILTHHQVLSVFDDCYTKQADQVFSILKRPVIWLWGHEHRMAIYEALDGTSRSWSRIIGRCIGHGGVPVDLPGKPYKRSIGKAAYVDQRLYESDENIRVGVDGFAHLTFRNANLKVDYVDVYGGNFFTEDFGV